MSSEQQLNATLAGRYEIEREIGRGGMATVYLARDVKHERHVALKVLDPELGAVLGAERFLSEIRVTANLQHPNLLPLFDSGSAGGLLFYVMPFVEGESLRARLERERQLPVDEAVRIAVAVAGALGYAHARGVIHRDLKPENILLQHDQPVVADFGIALAVSNAGGARVTQTGLSLGTPQYMSPEQAAGDRAIDGRSDVYSLGAVLFEMLTGDPPHTGSTVQAVIAKVLTERPPDVRVPRPTTPEHVAEAVAVSLEKLPADRFATAAQFADALRGARTDAATRAATRALRPAARPRWRDPWVVVPSALALLAGAAAVALALRPAPAPAPVRFVASGSPGDELFRMTTGVPVALAPDGRTVAYVARAEAAAEPQIFVRSLDELRPRPLPGTEGVMNLTWSPDGRSLAFETRRQLKRVSLDGGAPVTIAAVWATRGLSWGPNDDIIYADGEPKAHRWAELWRVPAAGGQPTPIFHPDSARGEGDMFWPRLLADGRTILYMSQGARFGAVQRIAVASLETGKTTILDLRGVLPLGVVGGRLAYVREDGVVMAAPFDARRAQLTGTPVPLLEGVQAGVNWAAAAAAPDGSVAYVMGASTMHLVLVSERGEVQSLTDDARRYEAVRVAPDGRRIALGSPGSGDTIDTWIFEMGSRTLTRLTTRGGARPEWTPDGGHVLFIRQGTRNRRMAIWRQRADFSRPAEELFADSAGISINEVVPAPDGRSLVYSASGDSRRDIWLLPLDSACPPERGCGRRRPLVTSDFEELSPAISPDGHWLAYHSNESGRYEVYVRPFPDAGPRWQVSAEGGTEARWSRDGRRLFFRRERQLMAATVAPAPARPGQPTPDFAVTARTKLFEGDFVLNPRHANYDVAPDGAGFIMAQPATDPQVVVATGWLRRR